MLSMMTVWSLYSVPRLIRWDNLHLFGVMDVLFTLWLLLPAAVALVCALSLRRGGRVVLHAVAGLCVTIVGLNVWFYEFGGPPVIQAIPFTVLTAIPLCFPSSWRYARERRRWHREREARMVGDL